MTRGPKYCIGDLIRLTTDADVRGGKVLAVDGVLITIGWANGATTEFSARVLERLTSEPGNDDQRQSPCTTKPWRETVRRDHAV